ncbi:MAG: hypothetical protein AB1352_04730 [Patescibacteria group bacterium]
MEKSKPRSIPVWVSVSLVVIVGLLAWLFIVMNASKVDQTISPNSALLPPPEEPLRITSVIGVITSLSADRLTLQALKVNNPQLSRDTALTIILPSDTQVAVTTVPATIPRGVKDVRSLYLSVSGMLSDLKVGQQVNVRAREDVRGYTEIVAKSIEITLVK